jgi:hypothetical protein
VRLSQCKKSPAEARLEVCHAKAGTEHIVVVSVAAFASQASAQDSAGRDAAIGRCIRVAHLQYPNEEQQIQRADVYKACMVAAGYQP